MRRSIALNPNLIRALLTLTILVLVSASTAAAQPAAVQGQGQNQGHAGEADGVEAACLVLLQVTRFISAFLRDPGGVRFEIIDGLLDRGFCARFQVLAFGRTETRLAFESWVRPASEDREVLKGRIREQLLQERAERADIELAFWRAFHLFKELESEGDVNERIIVLLSDGAFTAGSVERLFRETLPYLIREGIRVYIFRFYFLERPALYEIAQATGGLIWPGSRSSLPRALERIEADLFRERERREPARSGSEPRESTPPPAPGPVEVEPKPPLEGFLSSIVKEISVEIQTRRTYWDDETVRLEAAISYRDRMLGPEAIAIDLGGDPGLMRIEGVYASLAGGAQSQSQPLRFAGSRWMADLSLPVGTHTVELIVKGRVIRGTEEEPFQVQVEALRQIQIKERPVIALGLGMMGSDPIPSYTRYQPIELTLTLIEGDPADLTESPKVRMLSPQGDSVYLTPLPELGLGRDAGTFTVVYRPAAVGTFRFLLDDGESYRAAPTASELTVQVVPPALEVPELVNLTDKGCFTMRSTLYPPDVAILMVATDGRLKPDKDRIELTPERGEARLCLESLEGFSLMEQLRREGFRAQVRLLDVRGTFGEQEFIVTVAVTPPFPLTPMAGGAALVVALLAIPISISIFIISKRRERVSDFRGRSLTLTRRLKVGERVRIGRRVNPDQGWRLPGRELGEVHLSICRGEGGYRVRAESGLELFRNGRRVRLEEPLEQGDLLEFGEYKARVSLEGEELTLRIL